jgi:hypothetical protein
MVDSELGSSAKSVLRSFRRSARPSFCIGGIESRIDTFGPAAYEQSDHGEGDQDYRTHEQILPDGRIKEHDGGE